MEFFSSKIFLVWLPNIFFIVVFMAAALQYLFSDKLLTGKISRAGSFKLLILVFIFFRFIYAGALTISQYYVWTQSEFTKLFVNLPANSSAFLERILNKFCQLTALDCGYFLFYSYGRFWLNFLISIIVSLVFYLILIFLKKYESRFFEEGEIELGALMSLLVGWPNFVIFVPLVFIFIVIISIFRIAFFKKVYTNLGPAFLLAALAALIFGSKLVGLFNLGVLKV